MTPKEKAKELVMKYKDAPFNCKGCDMPFCDTPCTMLSMHEAKQCALIAVDEVISYCHAEHIGYWKEVYQNIKAL